MPLHCSTSLALLKPAEDLGLSADCMSYTASVRSSILQTAATINLLKKFPNEYQFLLGPEGGMILEYIAISNLGPASAKRRQLLGETFTTATTEIPLPAELNDSSMAQVNVDIIAYKNYPLACCIYNLPGSLAASVKIVNCTDAMYTFCCTDQPHCQALQIQEDIIASKEELVAVDGYTVTAVSSTIVDFNAVPAEGGANLGLIIGASVGGAGAVAAAIAGYLVYKKRRSRVGPWVGNPAKGNLKGWKGYGSQEDVAAPGPSAMLAGYKGSLGTSADRSRSDDPASLVPARKRVVHKVIPWLRSIQSLLPGPGNKQGISVHITHLPSLPVTICTRYD